MPEAQPETTEQESEITRIFRAKTVLPCDRIVVGYDNMDWSETLAEMTDLRNSFDHPMLPSKYRMAKVSAQLFEERCATVVEETAKKGGVLTMADVKLDMIGRSTHHNAKILTAAGVNFITVHASDGQDVLEAAIEGREEGRSRIRDPRLTDFIPQIGGILVETVLTHHSREAWSKKHDRSIKETVLDYARLAARVGADGVLCAAPEASAIEDDDSLKHLLRVVTNVTPTEHADIPNDQDRHRHSTPYQAVLAGADLVALSWAIFHARHGVRPKSIISSIAKDIGIAEKVREGLKKTAPKARARRKS